MGTTAEQHMAMQVSRDESLMVGILSSFIAVVKMSPVIAAKKTLTENDLQLDIVAKCLIETWSEVKKIPKPLSKVRPENSFVTFAAARDTLFPGLG